MVSTEGKKQDPPIHEVRLHVGGNLTLHFFYRIIPCTFFAAVLLKDLSHRQLNGSACGSAQTFFLTFRIFLAFQPEQQADPVLPVAMY